MTWADEEKRDLKEVAQTVVLQQLLDRQVKLKSTLFNHYLYTCSLRCIGLMRFRVLFISHSIHLLDNIQMSFSAIFQLQILNLIFTSSCIWGWSIHNYSQLIPNSVLSCTVLIIVNQLWYINKQEHNNLNVNTSNPYYCIPIIWSISCTVLGMNILKSMFFSSIFVVAGKTRRRGGVTTDEVKNTQECLSSVEEEPGKVTFSPSSVNSPADTKTNPDNGKWYSYLCIILLKKNLIKILVYHKALYYFRSTG